MPKKRTLIQISAIAPTPEINKTVGGFSDADPAGVIGLADDGSAWVLWNLKNERAEWERLPDIPQN